MSEAPIPKENSEAVGLRIHIATKTADIAKRTERLKTAPKSEVADIKGRIKAEEYAVKKLTERLEEIEKPAKK